MLRKYSMATLELVAVYLVAEAEWGSTKRRTTPHTHHNEPSSVKEGRVLPRIFIL